MNEVTLWIPGEPHGKARHRSSIQNGKVRTYPDPKSEEYEQVIAAIARRAIHRGAKRFEEGIPLEVEFWMYFSPLKKWAKEKKNPTFWTGKPDFDNVEKAILDAVVKAELIPDDSQISVCRGSYKLVTWDDKPGVRFIIREIGLETLNRVNAKALEGVE